MLNIAFGLFVEMTFESRSSCPFVGKDETIGPVVRIGPFVGIGIFGRTGPVVSLTYESRCEKTGFLHMRKQRCRSAVQ